MESGPYFKVSSERPDAWLEPANPTFVLAAHYPLHYHHYFNGQKCLLIIKVTLVFVYNGHKGWNPCQPLSIFHSVAIKVNGYTFRGSNCHFHCCLPYILVSSHKGKNLPPLGGKFFPFRVDPALGRLCPPGKQTGSHEYCLPLET